MKKKVKIWYNSENVELTKNSEGISYPGWREWEMSGYD